MSKEHQFIVKSIVLGNRVPMYLETYTLGDRSSQVYKDAIKLLNNEAQQEVSMEQALGNFGAERLKAVMGTLSSPEVDLTVSGVIHVTGQSGYVSPGYRLANELDAKYPNKNWKGKVNKALEMHEDKDSKYSAQDIAVCLMHLCPNPNPEARYLELLDMNIGNGAVRDLLRQDYDKMRSGVYNPTKEPVGLGNDPTFEATMASLDAVSDKRTLHINLDEAEHPAPEFRANELKVSFEKYETGRDKPAGIIPKGQELNPNFDAVVIPLEGDRRAWIQRHILDAHIVQAVDENWPGVKLRRKIENLFNTPDTPVWHTVVEGWFTTAIEVFLSNRKASDKILPSAALQQLRDSTSDVLSDQQLADKLHILYARGALTQEELVHAIFEVLGHPASYPEFLIAERSCELAAPVREMCLARFGMTEEPVAKPYYVLGESESQEICSVTQDVYYRHEQFKDHVSFGTRPGVRAQTEIIGVLSYELETNDNDAEHVTSTHYEFIYQGDSVFVTDRYGNTVDRLR